mgnify:CR=1 FL=1
MESKRRRFTREFRREAVALAESCGNVAEAARNLGVTENSLYRWRSNVNMKHPDKAARRGQKVREREELRRLRKENEKLRLERDFLKKATAFFAQQAPNDTSA